MPRSRALFFVTLGTLSSCEYWHPYSFTVQNTTQSSILTTYGDHTRMHSIVIEPGEKAVLFIQERGPQGSEPDYFDVTEFLDAFTVAIGDSLTSERNYLSNEAWWYHDGDYRTFVTTAEFE